MTEKFVRGMIILSVVVFLCAAPRSARADELLNISVNTSSLSNMARSEVVFELIDGSGTNDMNNMAILSGISLGGGTSDPSQVDPVSSGYTGNLESGIALTDTFSTVFGQFFTPGSMLSFSLDLTTKADIGVTPDEFSMFVLGPDGTPLSATPGPSGDELAIDLTSTGPVLTNYDQPLVTVSPVVPTPEPSTLLLLGTGLMACFPFLRKKANFTA